MMDIKGKKYIKGTLNISAQALVELKKMGVKPPKNHYPQGGEFDSFYLPAGETGEQFTNIPGKPGIPGHLKLASE